MSKPALATAPSPSSPELTLESSGTQLLLRDLLGTSIIPLTKWENLTASDRARLTTENDRVALMNLLVERALLTEYQAARICAGRAKELLLGNYRILECLSSGGSSVVLKGEHVRLNRLAAIKLLRGREDTRSRSLERFLREMQVVGQLTHPNIVAALDAGEFLDPESNTIVHYLVMEYVSGLDLESHVRNHGPFPVPRACLIAYQIAEALAEAHGQLLVHRDIKPSNIALTPAGQAKLLDFGLARTLGAQLTEPGVVLGTISYMAPEQARDPSAVDIRADLFALGGVLFWCLTGRHPFPTSGPLLEELTRRRTQAPPSVRVWRPEIPHQLDAVISRMMAPDPLDRYPEPRAVLQALAPFCPGGPADPCQLPVADGLLTFSAHTDRMAAKAQVLIVDDEAGPRTVSRLALQTVGIEPDEADDGLSALEAIRTKAYDLVLLDIDMPRLSGIDVLRRLRAEPPSPHLKIIMLSGRVSGDDMAEMMSAGADDFLSKPFSLVQLSNRVAAALRLKRAQERLDALNRDLLAINHELEQSLSARDGDLLHARNALVLALAELVGVRDAETGSHLLRLQRFSRCLAEQAAALPAFAGQIDANFIQLLECSAPLHDIGKAGLPDAVLLKPGSHSPEERAIMQTHTIIGADILQKTSQRHGFARAFFQMAIEITRHHHERYDGRGYPDQLEGESIPLAARILTIADVYDALRSRRIYKPALAHKVALEIILDQSSGQFDPALLQVFHLCEAQFERIFGQLAE